MNDKIKNMIDIAAADDVLTIEELKLIKKIAEKENVDWDEVEFYMLQVGALNEQQSEYDISDDNLISIISTWITRLKQGEFEGVAEPFPSKINDSYLKKAAAVGFKLFNNVNNAVKQEETKLNRFDKFKMNVAKKAINGSINIVPGSKLVRNVGSNLINQITPQARIYYREDIRVELDKYIDILELRVKTKKIKESTLTSIKEQVSEIE
ncbi:hypothetical protein AW14_14605 [Siansivirga zeaxanthinifaciens CC-SAMT-1]|uniref:Uncharacterized protein n=2 Tax=Siansivirga TaxID=1204360 RepID=A0A0C5W0Z6_9FLAO|nr:hypothetical protein AW14_14605 [Siansivirga zeaxanthinifaciens CC-SAMT-1]